MTSLDNLFVVNALKCLKSPESFPIKWEVLHLMVHQGQHHIFIVTLFLGIKNNMCVRLERTLVPQVVRKDRRIFTSSFLIFDQKCFHEEVVVQFFRVSISCLVVPQIIGLL